MVESSGQQIVHSRKRLPPPRSRPARLLAQVAVPQPRRVHLRSSPRSPQPRRDLPTATLFAPTDVRILCKGACASWPRTGSSPGLRGPRRSRALPSVDGTWRDEPSGSRRPTGGCCQHGRSSELVRELGLWSGAGRCQRAHVPMPVQRADAVPQRWGPSRRPRQLSSRAPCGHMRPRGLQRLTASGVVAPGRALPA